MMLKLALDLQKLREFTVIAENCAKEIEKLESEHEVRLKEKEALSIKKIDYFERQSMERIAEAEKLLMEERKEVDSKIEKFESMRNEVIRCAKGAKDKIRLNVGGVLFTAQRNTLLSIEDTFFCHLLGKFLFN